LNARNRILTEIKRIIFKEQRPFCFRDFAYPKRRPQEGKYAHGTVRNVFSTLRKEGRIELVYRSPQAFYTLTGIKFEKGMTPNYRGVLVRHQQDQLLKIFKVNKLDKPAIHDIRLLFNVKGLRNILLSNDNKSLIDQVDEKYNKDIRLKDIVHDDILVKTTVHNTDNVSVMIACSDNPVEIEDPVSLSKLTGGLTRVEERLKQEIDNYYSKKSDICEQESQRASIPYHMNWVVRMWHFGRDSSHAYSGQLFEITWKESLDTFHLYSKKKKKTTGTITVIRSELYEYPKVSLKDALKRKLDSLNI
jgi:hypothetical protein